MKIFSRYEENFATLNSHSRHFPDSRLIVSKGVLSLPFISYPLFSKMCHPCCKKKRILNTENVLDLWLYSFGNNNRTTIYFLRDSFCDIFENYVIFLQFGNSQKMTCARPDIACKLELMISSM